MRLHRCAVGSLVGGHIDIPAGGHIGRGDRGGFLPFRRVDRLVFGGGEAGVILVVALPWLPGAGWCGDCCAEHYPALTAYAESGRPSGCGCAGVSAFRRV